ncbi:sulfur carrier protein ThiS [Comamonas endophytica]|uniref:Sulfur carrier protein ThiS n=1 Tax=Comamonas endophytica TaxID=2949090 RepID=A0ABY6G8Q0_9BURK|nr:MULTISPECIES: sulfur carrier protein ThiS [unclassified Acidovorax]MCD2511687.1 sulfur carrier protein ThiS [Acidovorax sp. D4N7]UYG51417.1 sulfur carrier protein ThiS [Acidovorax sp. 5MLIR]
MNILLNQKSLPLPEGASLADALALQALRPPYAVAVNTQFVPRAQYAQWLLSEGDRVEVVSPVTGG